MKIKYKRGDFMARTKTKTTYPVAFRFEEDLLQDLAEYSTKSMIPKTRIVEAAIREYLERHKE